MNKNKFLKGLAVFAIAISGAFMTSAFKTSNSSYFDTLYKQTSNPQDCIEVTCTAAQPIPCTDLFTTKNGTTCSNPYSGTLGRANQ